MRGRILPVIVLLGMLIPGVAMARSGTSIQQVDLDSYPIQRVGANGDGDSLQPGGTDASISADGRFVAFVSDGPLVPEDANTTTDVYVYDRETEALEFLGRPDYVSPDSSGSNSPVISGDGQFVAFHAGLSHLMPESGDDTINIFRYERATSEIQIVSVDPEGNPSTTPAVYPSINDDGNVVAFETNGALQPVDIDDQRDIYVADLISGTMDVIGGTDGRSVAASLDGTGRYVSFQSRATDIVDGDTNGDEDVFVFDRQSGTVEMISRTADGMAVNGSSYSGSLSSNGRYVVFLSNAPNLTEDPSGIDHVIRYDRETGTSQAVDLDSSGALADGPASLVSSAIEREAPAGRIVSDDGRYVVFASDGTNMPGFADLWLYDRFIYRRDLELGMTELVSRSIAGVGGDHWSDAATMSTDGQIIAFESAAANMVYHDTNEAIDVLVRDMEQAFPETVFTLAHDRTDRPVAEVQVQRTWIWGPAALTEPFYEPYGNGERDNVLPYDVRAVQYFDKSRMEITHPGGDPAADWYVTNGLLVMEMITGKLQISDANYLQLDRARVNVAGDADDPTSPTYASFAGLLDAPPHPFDQPMTARVDRDGNTMSDPALANFGVEVAVVDDVTGHAIATPFWEFMTSEGTVWDGEGYLTDLLFANPYIATGRPVTEAYWATVSVGGMPRDVLMQCFERRCLTFTPGNPDGFIVEAGNVGMHYFGWRYSVQPLNPQLTGTVIYTDGLRVSSVDRDGYRSILSAPDGTRVRALALSPGGNRIAYVQIENATDADLYVIDSDGSNQQRLTTDGSVNSFRQISWSPDGSRILFGSGGMITSIAADGTERQALGPGHAPAWSPSGDRIAFISLEGPVDALMTMAPDGSDPNQVVLAPQNEAIGWGMDSFAWSPDGNRFVYAVRSSVSSSDFDDFRLFVINTDGSDGREIDTGDSAGGNPGWSTDGSLLTYVREHVIYAIAPDGSEPHGVIWDFSDRIEHYDWRE